MDGGASLGGLRNAPVTAAAGLATVASMVTTHRQQIAHVTRPARRTEHGLVVSASVAAFLVPWCVVLARTLPRTTTVGYWSLAWVGLDGGEALAAGATAFLIHRRDPRASLTAVAGAALLVCDAWFDVCTSASGGQRAAAVAEACFLELPLALGAVVFASRHLSHRSGDIPTARTGEGASHDGAEPQ